MAVGVSRAAVGIELRIDAVSDDRVHHFPRAMFLRIERQFW